jgi:hypothetical protein
MIKPIEWRRVFSVPVKDSHEPIPALVRDQLRVNPPPSSPHLDLQLVHRILQVILARSGWPLVWDRHDDHPPSLEKFPKSRSRPVEVLKDLETEDKVESVRRGVCEEVAAEILRPSHAGGTTVIQSGFPVYPCHPLKKQGVAGSDIKGSTRIRGVPTGELDSRSIIFIILTTGPVE